MNFHKHKNTVQTKLIFSYMLLILLIIAFVGLMPYRMYKSIIQEKVSNENLNTLFQIGGSFERIFGEVISASNMFYLNTELANILKKSQFEDLYDEIHTYRTVGEIITENTVTIYWMDYYIDIFDKHENHYKTWNSVIDLHYIQSKGWHNEIVQESSKPIWKYHFVHDKGKDESVFLLSSIRVLKDLRRGADLGFFVLSIDERVLSNIYINSIGEGEDIFLIDQSGKIVSASNRDMLGQNIGSMYVKNVTERDFGYFSDIESASLVSFAQINNSGLIIVKTTEEDVLFKDMNVTRNYLIFVCLLGIVVSVVAAYFISLQVSIPVKALDSGMKRVRQGNLSARVEIKSKDEFGRLGDTFNKMLERINQLIFDLKQEQESKRIAEIQSLQSRINPHFLYNTLSSIRYLISMGQQEIAEGAILSLIRLFKKMSGKDGELINIEEEVDLLNDYMKIQEIRYGGDYTILVNINEGLMKYKILKLTLQPLVENALIHGIRQNQTDGKIIISGYMKNDNIFIEIEDNGKGISEQVIKNIFNEEKQNNNSDLFNGTGIKNIHERIKLYFGHQYGLKIMNINPGTRVVVTIPARKE